MKHNWLLVLLMIFLFYQCVDTEFRNPGNEDLQFTEDTISFDTIFTTIGSITRQFKVKNRSTNAIEVSSVQLANANSFFHLNVDGEAGAKFKDITIPAGDSIYIFVEATIDPTHEDNPVLIEDAIVFDWAGKSQAVQLQAYGQDVTIFKNDTVETSVWAGKPCLILGNLWVKEGHTLTIEKGTVVYCHNTRDTLSINVMGKIDVKGTPEAPVIFRGDRLDEIWKGHKYDDVAGQWGGIYIYPSELKSTFSNCLIRNAIDGLRIGTYTSDIRTKVDLENTVIHNNTYSGLFAINAEMNIWNCQITNSGVFNFMVAAGGKYNVYQSTIANYYGLDRDTERSDSPCLAITNALQISDKYYAVNDLTEASFYNCIVDGDFDGELAFQEAADYAFNFRFDHCLLKVDETIQDDFPDRFVSCYFNKDSLFRLISEWNYNFELDSASFAIDKGNPALLSLFPELQYDLIGNERRDGYPDAGAYEFSLLEENTDR